MRPRPTTLWDRDRDQRCGLEILTALQTDKRTLAITLPGRGNNNVDFATDSPSHLSVTVTCNRTSTELCTRERLLSLHTIASLYTRTIQQYAELQLGWLPHNTAAGARQSVCCVVWYCGCVCGVYKLECSVWYLNIVLEDAHELQWPPTVAVYTTRKSVSVPLQKKA